MSLGDESRAERAALRATAHPIRLRIMSLLTGAPMTAAEVARELGITHANASYHLRNLLSGGMIVPAGEEKIRGGVAKRYRYDATHDHGRRKGRPRSDEQNSAEFSAIAHELLKRVRGTRFGEHDKLLADGDFWIEPEVWEGLRRRIQDAVTELHDAAKPPRTPGTIRTSTTVAMFDPITPEPERQ